MPIQHPTEPLNTLLRTLSLLNSAYKAIPPLLWIQLILALCILLVSFPATAHSRPTKPIKDEEEKRRE